METANVAPTPWYWRLLLLSLQNTSRPVIWGSLWTLISQILYAVSTAKSTVTVLDSRACKNSAACVKCGKAGHEGASCSNQEQCANCKGKHAASSRECPKWKLEKQVQQIKVERGISFPDARKAALSEQSTNTSSKRTVASVVSGTTTVSSQRSQKPKVSVAIQTELTWPQGADTPVPVKTNSQTMQTDSNENSAKKHRNTTSPSAPPTSYSSLKGRSR